MDTPYFDLKIHEEFVFSLLSSVQELFKSIKDFNSSEDSDAVANQEKEEKDSDPNLKLRIIQEQYLTIQSSLTEAQQDDVMALLGGSTQYARLGQRCYLPA